MSERIKNYIKQIISQTKWLIMSDNRRYAYLWNRTQETNYRYHPYQR
ncbi:hypothetical protein ACFLTZ_04615 [Chloroflexota bacterium]